ncbi:MAG TPA: photosynthetic reaction center cytochrome c subunit family protein [Gemmatimonadaceae bacterium]|nr:photosynthetic reaction center cytochrome c subunit family protein [Gemmatimonadaceae bacterium]
MKPGAVVPAVAAVIAVLSCTTTPSSQAPTPQGPSTNQAPAPTANQPGPGSAPQGNRRPNPIQQDSARRAQVDSIMRTIAGREGQPAGTVFKNVKVLKDMPAGEFLKNMDVNYGRGLGMGCGNCHVIGQYDGDTRKNKRVARQMQEMTDYINSSRLPQIKELDEDYVKVTCVTCHAGSGHPKDTMAVPQPASSAAR